jgi:hypothetical protein
MCTQLAELLSHGWHVHLDNNRLLYRLFGYEPPVISKADAAKVMELVLSFPLLRAVCSHSVSDQAAPRDRPRKEKRHKDRVLLPDNLWRFNAA